MKSINILRIAFALTILSTAVVCSAQSSVLYPKGSGLTVGVTDEPLSRLTETAVDDKRVLDSQVYLAGTGSFTLVLPSVGSVQIGAPARELSSGDSLALRFTDILLEALENSARGTDIQVVPKNSTSSVALRPYIKLTAIDNQSAEATAYIDAKVSNGGSSARRVYSFPILGAQRIIGPSSWSENNGEHLNARAKEAFAALATAFIRDFTGEFDSVRASSAKPVNMRFRKSIAGKPMAFLPLGKAEGFIFLSPVLMGRAIHGFMVVTREEEIEVIP